MKTSKDLENAYIKDRGFGKFNKFNRNEYTTFLEDIIISQSMQDQKTVDQSTITHNCDDTNYGTVLFKNEDS